MFAEIEKSDHTYDTRVLSEQCNYFMTIMGRIPKDINNELNLKFLKMVARYIHLIHSTVLKNRVGIG